jgi:hypothetical protein
MVRRKRQPTATRAGAAAMAAGALIVLAACGSQVPRAHVAAVPGGQASARVALCRDIPKLTSVAITRMMPLRVTQPGQVLPRGMLIKQPMVVRHLATVLCALPRAPRGPVSCPADFGGTLRLVFTAGDRSFRPVTVHTSGCRTVAGLGPARTVPESAIRTLGLALGLKFPAGPASQSGGGLNP